MKAFDIFRIGKLMLNYYSTKGSFIFFGEKVYNRIITQQVLYLMDKKRAKIKILSLFLVLVGIVLTTYLLSFVIKGYRPSVKQSGLVGFLPTGLLVANSDPKGASVYINDKLATATDDTISLSPDIYEIKIEKDGFLPWKKTLEIKKEIVAQTEAILFRTAVNLKPLTTSGAISPTLSPDGSKIVYAVTSAGNNIKNGVWTLDLSSNLPLSRTNIKQISGPINGINWQTAEFIWSPDNKEVVLITKETEKEIANAYLIPSDKNTSSDKLVDVLIRLALILEEWQNQKNLDLKAQLRTLPKELIDIATSSATMIRFSNSGKKLFYLTKEKAFIPENLIPHPPARSNQLETRSLEPGNIYVYDLEQDINFLIGSSENLNINKKQVDPEIELDLSGYQTDQLYWLTDQHLVFIDKENNQVKTVEFDNTNEQVIYSGPFNNGFVFPSPNSKSLIVLTSLHPDSTGDLYEISIR